MVEIEALIEVADIISHFYDLEQRIALINTVHPIHGPTPSSSSACYILYELLLFRYVHQSPPKSQPANRLHVLEDV